MGVVEAVAGLGSAFLGNQAANKQAETQAAATQAAIDASLTGFNYLQDNQMVNAAQTQGAQAQDVVGGLLGLGGDPAAAEQAFQQYQDSTGYQFRLDEGMGAIEGSQASRGLLNSGATAKALTQYGQDMASQEFNNYLAQVMGQQQTGLDAAYNVASQGTTGGSGAANASMTGAANQNQIYQTGLNNVMAGIGTAVGGLTSEYYY